MILDLSPQISLTLTRAHTHTYTHSQFLLSAVVVFSEVTRNTESEYTKMLLLSEI